MQRCHLTKIGVFSVNESLCKATMLARAMFDEWRSDVFAIKAMQSLSRGNILDNPEGIHDKDCWVDEMLRYRETIQPLDDFKTRVKEDIMALWLLVD
jgi:hypothetical protein